MIITRRQGIIGALAVLAAPAIARSASLMPIRPPGVSIIPIKKWPDIGGLPPFTGKSTLLTMQQITKEAIRIWTLNNTFLDPNAQWPEMMAEKELRIRVAGRQAGEVNDW